MVWDTFPVNLCVSAPGVLCLPINCLRSRLHFQIPVDPYVAIDYIQTAILSLIMLNQCTREQGATGAYCNQTHAVQMSSLLLKCTVEEIRRKQFVRVE